MQENAILDNDMDNNHYKKMENDSVDLSLNELRKLIKNNLTQDNKFYPFTKEWEWDECCNNSID